MICNIAFLKKYDYLNYGCKKCGYKHTNLCVSVPSECPECGTPIIIESEASYVHIDYRMGYYPRADLSRLLTRLTLYEEIHEGKPLKETSFFVAQESERKEEKRENLALKKMDEEELKSLFNSDAYYGQMASCRENAYAFAKIMSESSLPGRYYYEQIMDAVCLNNGKYLSYEEYLKIIKPIESFVLELNCHILGGKRLAPFLSGVQKIKNLDNYKLLFLDGQLKEQLPIFLNETPRKQNRLFRKIVRSSSKGWK